MTLPRPILFGRLPTPRAIRARNAIGWLATVAAVVLVVWRRDVPAKVGAGAGLFLVMFGVEVGSRLAGGVLVTRQGLRRFRTGVAGRLHWSDSGALRASQDGIHVRSGGERMLLPYDLDGLGHLVYWLRAELQWPLEASRTLVYGTVAPESAGSPVPFLPRTGYILPGAYLGGMVFLAAALMQAREGLVLAALIWTELWWYARRQRIVCSASYWERHVAVTQVEDLRERGLLGLWADGDRWVAQFERASYVNATSEFALGHPLPTLLWEAARG